jgi:hypothetical protein
MSYSSREPFNLVADQAEADAQTGLFGVYLSAIDFNDNFYTLMDSIAAYRQHDFHYDEGIALIAKFPSYDSAVVMADDLHQVVMRLLSIQDFRQRYNLQPSSELQKQIHQYQNATDFSIYNGGVPEFAMIPWCRALGWELDCLQFDENTDEEDYEDWEILGMVVEELTNEQAYDRLEQLREALKIGKFAFVHPTPEA